MLVVLYYNSGWPYQRSLFHTFDLYRCKICCKWAVASQDQWFLPVCFLYTQYGLVCFVLFCVCTSLWLYFLFQICRQPKCLLDGLLYKQTCLKTICPHNEWVLPGTIYILFPLYLASVFLMVIINSSTTYRLVECL